MKKSLLALAIMSAFSTVHAANVQIYGVVDAGIDYIRSGGKSVAGVESGLASDSRIGFRGGENLGNGVEAKFVLEQGFNIDSGSSIHSNSWFSRQAWVGLSNKDLGEIRLGRQHTPLYEITGQLDPFSAGLAGNAVNYLGMGGYQLRVDNAVTYVSPSISGFKGKIQYGFGETPGSMSDNRFWGLGGSYSVGNLGIGLAYSDQKLNIGNLDNQRRDLLLGATYDFKPIKAHIAYGKTKNEDNISATSDKIDNYLVGISAPIGTNSTILASYIHSDVNDLTQGKSNIWSLGYKHNLSKRTNVYTSYSYVSNQDNVSLFSAGNGKNTNRFNFGVNHSF